MQGKSLLLCLALCASLGASLAFASAGRARTQTSTGAEQYGVVHFPVSCTPAAQEQFDRAVALLHSFFFPETLKAFTKVTELDPECAMAYWGLAFSQLPNPLVGVFDPAMLERGLEAVERGKTLNPKTQREKDWLDALELFFKDADTLDQPTRSRRYAEAMERVYRTYPDDQEAAAFYALALNGAAPLIDKTYANQLKAAAILEKLAVQQPNTPASLALKLLSAPVVV